MGSLLDGLLKSQNGRMLRREQAATTQGAKVASLVVGAANAGRKRY